MRLSPEEQFISHVLSLSLKPRDPHSEERIWPRDGINRDEFIRLVARHGLGGLLFYWLRELKLENTLPLDVYEGLGDIYESLRSLWQNHREILKGILMRFYEREVEVILLKGAQLAHSDYPDFCLRPIGDIDLLVRSSNRVKVIRLMLEMGFTLYETNQTCDKFFIRRVPKRPKKTLPKPIFVEVHSNLRAPIRLNRSFSIDMDEFWNGTQEGSIFGFPFLQLCPTHNLIYLGAHLSHHYFSRLIWTYDIALLVHRHREEIDWRRLENICGNMRIRNSLYHSL
ncbi:MAG: nucleotidyltransferase family protein, partial [Syntrophobacterales bacterium]